MASAWASAGVAAPSGTAMAVTTAASANAPSCDAPLARAFAIIMPATCLGSASRPRLISSRGGGTAKQQREIVGRHWDNGGCGEARLGGERRDRLHIAHTPGGVAAAQIGIERRVARGRVLAVAAIRTVEKQKTA